MPNVLFIGYANCGRSQLAAGYFQAAVTALGRTAELGVDCAGLRVKRPELIAPEVATVLAEYGALPLRQASRQLTSKTIGWADVILCMTSDMQEELDRNYPGATRKSKTLMSVAGSSQEVFDPNRYGGSAEKYRACLQMMQPALDCLSERLLG